MAGKTSMKLGEAVRIATASLWAHKLRSVLTLLGVVIGVMSVIAVVSIVNGLNRYVAEKVFNLGADVFLVSRGPIIITNIDEYQETQKRRKIRLDDYEAVHDACQSCQAVGASIDHMGAQVKSGTDYLSNSHVLGWTPEMPLIYELDLIAGRHINQLDVSRGAPVCTVGWEIADKLLPAMDPIGKEIRVDTLQCQVIGVGKKLGSVMGQSRDNWIIFPITTFQKAYSSDDSIRLWAKSGDTTTLQATMDEVRLLLRGRRHVPYSSADDFTIETNQSFLSLWGSISGAFFGVTIVIASISLVVGGIVIMNIMLASVTERTREIGLRRSLGARKKHIVLQFMTESAVLAAVGGIMGLALAYGIVALVRAVTPIPVKTPLSAVIISLSVSTAVGLFFGIYPAMRAAKLDPIEALRADG